ncbi:uncharacterized protein J3R85_014247 [Psidium guajava]|nr:uncharacterized protein J3R85_014247 [Psidium guajava]
MASSSDHHHGERPKPDEDEHQPKPNSPPDGNHNSASPPPPSAGHQDATTPNNYDHQPHSGYPPPVMGYPPPYPPPHNINGGYPYGAPPPPSGYYPANNPHYYRSQAPSSAPSGFARGILAGLIFLVVASCTITVITYVVLRPQTPEFHVTAFSVNNFNISNSVLMGSWNANVSVDNKNDKLKAYFERIQSYVYYQDPRSYLSWSTEPAFSLDTKTSGVINVKMSMIDGEQPTSSELEELDEERRNGTVIFGLGFGLLGTFKSGWWTSHFGMRVYCHDLAVGFAGASGTGILRDPNPRQCTVYL